MPGGINGFELANQAKDKYPDLKVLLTSGYSEKAAREHSQSKLAKRLRAILESSDQ